MLLTRANLPQTTSKMKRSTAVAHSNLAFVKYWGKRDARLNIPLNNSISMNLSAAQTITTVTFDDNLAEDRVMLDDHEADAKFAGRVSQHLDRVRFLAGTKNFALVETRNTFPASTGVASSASGFAALTVAAASALELGLSERDLSILARRGSGSACRSIPAGFVEWLAGENENDSFAVQVAPADHWDIVDVAVLVTSEAKQVSSSDGHQLAMNSPFWGARLDNLPQRLAHVRRAILDRDFSTFGCEIEAEAMSMHAIMLTSSHETEHAWHSGIYYWSPDTLKLLIAVQQWREDGLEVYFTLDAGPTVHLICPVTQQTAVHDAVQLLAQQQPVDPGWLVLVSHPAPGSSVIEG
jgi:diphosphomevalonate decarboxylase